ncbi:Caleosin related protein-domain-containing protein [Sporodiniella umbellata]|nr:Caleosin related protein-domain-containing protein [Sporodiniella umbellata]
MTQPRIIQSITKNNAIQNHVDFWDYRKKGYISPIDIVFGLLSLGYGVISSTVLGFFLALALSVSLQVSWLPDFFFRFSSSALVTSRQQLSGVFDGNGVLIPEKFEALYKRHAKSDEKITIVELLYLTNEQKKLGLALKEWAITLIELFAAYFFVGQKGCFLKEDLMALYNGALFYQVELKYMHHSKQSVRRWTAKEQLMAMVHAVFNVETYGAGCTTFGEKCALSSDSPCVENPVTDNSNVAVFSRSLIVSSAQNRNGEQPKEKKKPAVILTETAVVLHSSNLWLPFVKSFSDNLKTASFNHTTVVDTSSYSYGSAEFYKSSGFFDNSANNNALSDCGSSASSDNMSSCGSYSCGDSDISASFDESSIGTFDTNFAEIHVATQTIESYRKLSTVSSYCDASASSDIPLSQLASHALQLMAQNHKLAAIPVSTDCSSKVPSIVEINDLISGEEFTQISSSVYTPPKMEAIQLFCQGVSKNTKKTKKTKKNKKSIKSKK